MPQYVQKTVQRACQGDIYGNLTFYETRTVDGKQKETTHGYAVVLTQECDLSEDWRNYRAIRDEGKKSHDKLLRHVILAPCYPFARFLKGEHIKDRTMSTHWNASDTTREAIMANNHKRFHFLKRQPDVNLVNLVIDFKHYFSVERDAFYEAIGKGNLYVTSLDSLFREDLSQRFAYYLARIGLPEGKPKEALSGGRGVASCK